LEQAPDVTWCSHPRKKDDGEVPCGGRIVDEDVDLRDVRFSEILELVDVVHPTVSGDGGSETAGRHSSSQPAVKVIDAEVLHEHGVNLR
jgi:hypothetical protein